VDSITTRGRIFDAVKELAGFYVDGRMNAEVIRVLASPAPDLEEHYATTLFLEEEAVTGACTARSTIYTASIAAGLMVGQFTRWLRGLEVERDLVLNLFSSEMVCQ
jgi:molybdopterin-synthase adenylyltransferase